MARVYEGRLDSLAGVSTRVAIKVIHPEHANDQAFQDLFITEARISARLEHQNLVRVQQFNREGDLYYLVMELIDGITLRKIISLCRRHQIQLPVSVIAELGRQACEGLDYAHSLRTDTGELMSLVHRDIKPSNLMLTNQGVMKVLDFGISYSRGTEIGSGVKGTWGYMALEQIEGRKVGPPADVYGLGAVLFELATLEPLFEEKDNNRIRERMLEDEAARRAAGIGGPAAELGAVLVRALQRDPAARFNSATSLGRALSRLITNPVTIRDDLIALGQNFRGLDENNPGSIDRVRSITTVPSQVDPRTGSALGLPVATGTVHGPIMVPAEERLRANERQQPAWLPMVLGAAVMSTVASVATVLAVNHMSAPSAVPVTPVAVQAPVDPPVAPVATPPVAPVANPPVEATPPVVNPPVETAPTSGSKPRTPKVPVNVAPVTPPPVQAAPAATGMGGVTIRSVPKSQVTIDGKVIEGSVVGYKLPAGVHRVRLDIPGSYKEFEITVVPDQTVSKSWSFNTSEWL